MNIKNIYPYLITLTLSIFAISPLFSNGFFPMHDDTQVARVFGMTKSLIDGQFPVRWVEDLGYGYGYPIFNFYAPLPYYIGGLFDLIAFDSLMATKIMFIVGILLSGISMYLFSSRFFGKIPGIVSAVIFMYFPYHAVNIYVRGAVGEFFAYALIPLLFLGLFKIFQLSNSRYSKRKLEYLLLTSFSFSLILISHILTGIMLTIVLSAFFTFSLFFVKRKVNFLAVSILSLFLGLLISSFFTIPAFFEMKYTNVASQIGGGANYNDHFVCIQQFISSNWGFGGSVPGCVDGMSFMLGKFNILLIVISVMVFVYLYIRKSVENNPTKLIIISLYLLIISLFLQTMYSVFIWNSISIMEYIQYPWRFMNFTGLFLSYIVGFLVYSMLKIENKTIQLMPILIVLLILVFNIKFFSPQLFLNLDSDYYTHEKNLHFKTSKISDEYLPSGFKKPLNEDQIIKEEIQIDNGFVQVLENKTAILTFNYSNNSDLNQIIIFRTYFPGWKVFVNGQEKEISKYDNSFIKLNIERGEGNVKLKLFQTPIEILGNFATLVTAALIFTVIIVKSLKIKVLKIIS